MKSIKRMLQDQELVVGLMIQQVCEPWIAKIYADAGTDFVYVEGEHMLFNGADLAGLILTCRLCGLPVVSKSPYGDRGAIAKLLDAGVTGIQLPMSETAEQLEQFVRMTHFPPRGIRAAAPGTGNTTYEPVDSAAWLREADEEITVLAHIESQAGLQNVDAILEVPGVDIMFIGMFDLSVSLGHPAQYEHPQLVQAMKRMVHSARAHGKHAGMWAPSYETAQPWIKEGVRFFETAGDVGLIARGAGSLMKQFPGHAPRTKPGVSHL